jgi:hypothetical protein
MNPNALPLDISSPVTHGENKFISRDNKRIKLTNPDELQPDISTDVENKSVSTDNKGTGEYMYSYGLAPCMENQGESWKSMLSSTSVTGGDKSVSTDNKNTEECDYDFGHNVKKLDESDQEKLDEMVKEAHMYNITRFMGGCSFYFGPP